MKSSLAGILIVAAGLVCSPVLGANETADPVKMLGDIEKILRSNSHIMTASMEVKTASWTRNYKFKIWMDGPDKTFVRVLLPAKVEGQGFLRLKARLWNYLPTAERTILIPPSLMFDRFMGSDFSNDDFVKMSYLPRDYAPTILGRETIDGVDLYRLELKPKENAAVTYSKLILLAGVADSMPFRMEFYNEQGEHIRTLDYSEVKSFKDHALPSRWKMVDHREKNRETFVTVEDAAFDVSISEEIFSNRNLEKYP